MLLNLVELEDAQNIINSKLKGFYTAQELYGVEWLDKTPTTFGKKFKAAVLNGSLKNIRVGKLPNIRIGEPRSDNNYVYEVF